MQNTDPISGLSEPSSDHESEHDNQDVIDVAITERLFVTGVLDELKVCFSYSYQVSIFVVFSCISFKSKFPLALKLWILL